MECPLEGSPTELYDGLDPATDDVSLPRRGVWPLIGEPDAAAGALPFNPRFIIV